MIDAYKKRATRISAGLVLIVLSSIPLWVAYRHPPFLNDDTYITLTYAKSIAAGRGFVFNQPPATLGTTTPLLALVVAGTSSILPGVEVSKIAVLFTALCWIGIIWGVYLGRERLGLSRWQAVTVGGVVIASGWIGFLGMEAYLFAFLLIFTMILYLQRRWLSSGVLVGLLFLTRGEGILMLPTLLLYRLGQTWNERSRARLRIDSPSLKLVFGCLLVVLVWSVYAWSTFGYILPNTLSAKAAQRSAGHWESFSHRLLQDWLPTWGRQFAFSPWPRLNLWWILASIGLGVVLLKKRQWLILVIWMSFYTAGYAILDVAGYWWYQLPILFVVQLLVALGLAAVEELATTLDGKANLLGHALAIVLVVAVTTLLARPRVTAILRGTGDLRASSYLALADWINENTDPAQSIAYLEIGYLGYHTDNRIVDLMGLVTPGISPYIAEGDFASGFWAYEPDYFIYLPDFSWALASIREDPRFEQRYRAVTTLPGPRETDFAIYARVGPSG